MTCKQCGINLSRNFGPDTCTDCSRENLKKTFAEHPELKQAFRAAIEEMRKPENIEKDAAVIAKTISVINELRKEADYL